MSRRLAILLGVLLAVLIGGTAAVILLLSDDVPLASAVPSEVPAAQGWTGPVRVESPDAAGEALATAEDLSLTWSESADTTPQWVDIARIGVIPDFENWQLDLRAHHPGREELAAAGQVLAFGFVMDTNADGVADYVVGIGSDAPGSAVHVWLTDLTSGETDERFDGPYGDPFDFFTTLEEIDAPGQPRPSGASFFNIGAAPPELFDSETTRFYAWSSLTEDGEVVAWDYAPDTGWLGAPQAEQLGCTLLACPMTGPDPGPGSRQWIISVENRSATDAHLFVAEDRSPMGELVGTATPASVAAGATERVVFTVPEGSGWAIFVNPSPTMGALIGAVDVPPDISGVMPMTITVQPGGAAGVSAPSAPGWFGN